VRHDRNADDHRDIPQNTTGRNAKSVQKHYPSQKQPFHHKMHRNQKLLGITNQRVHHKLFVTKTTTSIQTTWDSVVGCILPLLSHSHPLHSFIQFPQTLSADAACTSCICSSFVGFDALALTKQHPNRTSMPFFSLFLDTSSMILATN